MATDAFFCLGACPLTVYFKPRRRKVPGGSGLGVVDGVTREGLNRNWKLGGLL
jgi:hypothetical protein